MPTILNTKKHYNVWDLQAFVLPIQHDGTASATFNITAFDDTLIDCFIVEHSKILIFTKSAQVDRVETNIHIELLDNGERAEAIWTLSITKRDNRSLPQNDVKKALWLSIRAYDALTKYTQMAQKELERVESSKEILEKLEKARATLLEDIETHIQQSLNEASENLNNLIEGQKEPLKQFVLDNFNELKQEAQAQSTTAMEQFKTQVQEASNNLTQESQVKQNEILQATTTAITQITEQTTLSIETLKKATPENITQTKEEAIQKIQEVSAETQKQAEATLQKINDKLEAQTSNNEILLLLLLNRIETKVDSLIQKHTEYVYKRERIGEVCEFLTTPPSGYLQALQAYKASEYPIATLKFNNYIKGGIAIMPQSPNPQAVIYAG